jgi:putative transposase
MRRDFVSFWRGFGMDAIYPSDMNDEQWEAISRLLPPALPGGRPRSVNMRQVLNAIFYIARGGCSWRMLPKDYPPWETVYYYFARFKKDGTWYRIHELLRRRVRLKQGKKQEPSAAILDSQSVKTTEKGGYMDTTRVRRSMVESGIFSSIR